LLRACATTTATTTTITISNKKGLDKKQNHSYIKLLIRFIFAPAATLIATVVAVVFVVVVATVDRSNRSDNCQDNNLRSIEIVQKIN